MNRRHRPGEPVSRSELRDLLARQMRERELQENVRQHCTVTRWRYYHTHRSEHSPDGFPDCVMVRIRPEEFSLLFIELKRQSESPTPAQQAWLDDVAAIGYAINQVSEWLSRLTTNKIPRIIIRSECWRPMDWLTGRIENVLNDPSS